MEKQLAFPLAMNRKGIKIGGERIGIETQTRIVTINRSLQRSFL